MMLMVMVMVTLILMLVMNDDADGVLLLVGCPLLPPAHSINIRVHQLVFTPQ